MPTAVTRLFSGLFAHGTLSFDGRLGCELTGPVPGRRTSRARAPALEQKPGSGGQDVILTRSPLLRTDF